MGHLKNGCFPVIHGILTGCDISSKGIGKSLALKKFAKRLANVFLKESSKDVLRAGEIIITNPSDGAHYEGHDIQEICK